MSGWILYLWIVTDPVFEDCQGSCICGLSPGFVDDQDLLERLSGAFASLFSDPSDCRDVCPFVTPARAQIPKSASTVSKNVDNVDKMSKNVKNVQNVDKIVSGTRR